MVDIPVDHGNALRAVNLLGVTCRDCDVVEEAKAHCPRSACMVPRRTHGRESIVHLPGHYLIDCLGAAPAARNAASTAPSDCIKPLVGCDIDAGPDVWIRVSECDGPKGGLGGRARARSDIPSGRNAFALLNAPWGSWSRKSGALPELRRLQ
jgi:hypothetical protein